MPSYTFVSTANAFVLRGAKIVFVDIRRDTMNIDETLIEAAITDKTGRLSGALCRRSLRDGHHHGHRRQIQPVCGGRRRAGVMSTYKGRALGTIGHIGCFSFHETKNYTAGGEGGATLINDRTLVERAEIIREKAPTAASSFAARWINIPAGHWLQLSDVRPAGRYLWAQLEAAERINQQRRPVAELL